MLSDPHGPAARGRCAWAEESIRAGAGRLAGPTRRKDVVSVRAACHTAADMRVAVAVDVRKRYNTRSWEKK